MNKGTILQELNSIPANAHLCLDVRPTKYLDYDVMEILDEFAIKAKSKNITVELIFHLNPKINPYRGEEAW